MVNWPENLTTKAAGFLEICKKKNLRFCTVESCTGGLVSALFTSFPGSSKYFERGLVTYSNQAKMDLVGVTPELLNAHGAVSSEVAEKMAVGAALISNVDIAVSITGIAGPDGGTDKKPVGLVYIAVATKSGQIDVEKHLFDGERNHIRLQAVEAAIDLISRIAG